MKYRWTYVDSRGKWYLKSKSYYSFGTTLHHVLQRFHDSDDSGVTTTSEAVAAYEENWLDAGFSSAEEMAEAYGEGKLIIQREIEASLTKPMSSKTLFVEKQLRLDFGKFDLVGRLDRVDEHPDGTLEIVDYKTGRGSVDEADVASDMAMSCYQLLLREMFPERPVLATIVALRSGLSASHSMTVSELGQFRQDVWELGEIILAEEFYDLTPRLKPLCKGCDFRPLCRKHEDFAEEEAIAGVSTEPSAASALLG